MPYEFAQVRIKSVQVCIFPDPLVQPVNTVSMAQIMDSRFIALGDRCFWEHVPEFMKPHVWSRF